MRRAKVARGPRKRRPVTYETLVKELQALGRRCMRADFYDGAGQGALHLGAVISRAVELIECAGAEQASASIRALMHLSAALSIATAGKISAMANAEIDRKAATAESAKVVDLATWRATRGQ